MHHTRKPAVYPRQQAGLMHVDQPACRAAVTVPAGFVPRTRRPRWPACLSATVADGHVAAGPAGGALWGDGGAAAGAGRCAGGAGPPRGWHLHPDRLCSEGSGGSQGEDLDAAAAGSRPRSGAAAGAAAGDGVYCAASKGRPERKEAQAVRPRVVPCGTLGFTYG